MRFRTRLFILLLLATLLMPVCRSSCFCAEAETTDQILCGYSELRGFPENGVRATCYSGVSEYPIYLPDGLRASVAYSAQHSEFGYFELPGNTEILVKVDKSLLVDPEDYKPAIDFPQYTVERKTALYETIENDHTGIISVAVPRDVLTVLAFVNSYYYVCDQVGNYGFVDQNSIPRSHFLPTKTHRYYDEHLMYFEEEYIAAKEPANCRITREQAIQTAKDWILTNYPQETEAHLAGLSWSAFYNSAHEYGNWGMTWQVIAYGSRESLWIEPNPYYYTPCDMEMPYHDFSEYLDSDYEFSTVSREEHADILAMNFGDSDVSGLHIHYIVTVIIDRTERNVFQKGDLLLPQ